MTLPENILNLVASIEYAAVAITAKEVRTAYLEYTGNKFTEDFPKPAENVKLFDYLRQIIYDNHLEIKVNDVEKTFVYKKFSPPKKKKLIVSPELSEVSEATEPVVTEAEEFKPVRLSESKDSEVVSGHRVVFGYPLGYFFIFLQLL